MWYFSWILGLGFAGAFSILNAMWLELTENPETPEINRLPIKQDLGQQN